jgi:bifunctional non-homologous end joining protein LigD
LDGVLLSWAIPKGPSLHPDEKRLAIRTEDHPVEYSDFEGIIPPGNYGAGAMILWDMGRWVPVEDPREGLKKGKLLFDIWGYKLKGRWTIFLTSKGGKEWLMMKKPDNWASRDRTCSFPEHSILSGLSIEEYADRPDREKEAIKLLKGCGAKARKIHLEDIDLMLAGTAPGPFNSKDWWFELKYDGYRLLAEKDDARVRLQYRGGKDVTRLYPEVTRSLASVPVGHFIADCEIVVLDHQGKPNFQLLQERSKRPGRFVDAVELPVTLFAFDLLGIGSFDLRDQPLLVRKRILRSFFPKLGPLTFVEHYEQRGINVFEQVSRLGLEGIIAKKASGRYVSGRSDNWLKIPANRTANFLIAGFTEPKGSRTGFGALHLGTWKDGELRYCGRVGTGFSEAQLAEIRSILDPLQVPKPSLTGSLPRGAEHRWVSPEIACEVRFKEWTNSGLVRQPVFLRVKPHEDLSDLDLITARLDRLEIPRERVAEKVVHFTNLSKIFWEDEGFLKENLIEYYRSVSHWLLPYLKNRFLVLERYPNGISGSSFFQKNAGEGIPHWVRTEQLWDEESNRGTNYIICSDEETLLLLANLATIPIHIWASRTETLGMPDWIILDLDPRNCSFLSVIRVAQEIRAVGEELGVLSFIKTSGGKGLHILIPTGCHCDFQQARMIAELIAAVVNYRVPELSTLDRSLKRREGKVFIDCGQNGLGKLLVSPFSVRPLPGAPVSMPLKWEEVVPGLSPLDFTIFTAPKRMKQTFSDPMIDIFTEAIDFPLVLDRIEKAIKDSKWFD